MRAGVEPCGASAEDLDVEEPCVQVEAIQVGYLEFPAPGGLERPCELNRAAVVEVDPRDCEIGLGLARLLLERDDAAVLCELDDAIVRRVRDMVAEDRGPLRPFVGRIKGMRQVVPVEEVVAEDQGARRRADKPGADQVGLGQPLRASAARRTRALCRDWNHRPTTAGRAAGPAASI